jgi:hypothetical protein
MTESNQPETADQQYSREDFTISTEDGVPAIELPTGQVLRLRTRVRAEDRHGSPIHGCEVPLAAEVDADDFAWWVLYPEADDTEFPRVSIEPQIVDAAADDIADTDNYDVHPTPTCPECGGKRTRPLDENVAVCFDCDLEWRYEEDYSEFWEGSVDV